MAVNGIISGLESDFKLSMPRQRQSTSLSGPQSGEYDGYFFMKVDGVKKVPERGVHLEFIQDEDHAILISSHITSDLEKAADYITYLHNGRVVVSGAKDELLDTYGKLVCGRADLERVEPSLLVGVRTSQFGCEALVKDRHAFTRRYPALTVDPVTLEDIMVLTGKGDAR